MNQFEALWEYQQADLALAKLNDDLKSTPAYTQYLRLKKTYKKHHNMLESLDRELSSKLAKQGEYASKLAELVRAFDLEKSELEIMESDEGSKAEELTEAKKSIEKLVSSINALSKELNSLVSWCRNANKQIGDTYALAASAKKELDAAKQTCEKERQDAVPEANRIKEEILEKRKAVPPELLKKYSALKESVPNPVAKVVGETCGGCRMSLSSVIVRKVAAGNVGVECETCGRILVQ
ncbi:MAG: C4-type zinc ribbon domain-containing protein [Clostridiales bacterium]|nr:C4-type zinc ribbon domain-containing protein [Clostridiales bacterium]MDY2597823.1 C4-type zinc ribbon domain-containing protein [Eubacteriales bacterium]MDY4622611.1 C4-type zinc ribbon domain-containing protein [Eubacteriales bacterium]